MSIEIKRNSECLKCNYQYKGTLKIEIHPKSKEQIIICDDCFKKLENLT